MACVDNPPSTLLLLPSARRAFVACPRELRRAGRPQDAALFSVSQPPVALQDACDSR